MVDFKTMVEAMEEKILANYHKEFDDEEDIAKVRADIKKLQAMPEKELKKLIDDIGEEIKKDVLGAHEDQFGYYNEDAVEELYRECNPNITDEEMADWLSDERIDDRMEFASDHADELLDALYESPPDESVSEEIRRSVTNVIAEEYELHITIFMYLYDEGYLPSYCMFY